MGKLRHLNFELVIQDYYKTKELRYDFSVRTDESFDEAMNVALDNFAAVELFDANVEPCDRIVTIGDTDLSDEPATYRYENGRVVRP